MNMAPIIKAVRAYDAEEWELFIREWVKGLSEYHQVQKLGGSGDLGRDVIGLRDVDACEGDWDNYQCKHYQAPLQPSVACEDAGKIIFHAFRGEFKPPRRYYFVAPRGVSTELRDLLLNPTKFKSVVLGTWNIRVANKVVAGETHELVGALKEFVEDYDFTSFAFSNLHDILDQYRKTAFWAERFGGLLPPPPVGITPGLIAKEEAVYVARLLEIYEDQIGTIIKSAEDLIGHDESYASDLQRQRERFYHAEAFIAHYRDQTYPGTVESFQDQIHDAIDPAISGQVSSHSRLSAALVTAASANIASILSPQARVNVRQGVCHQLANADRVKWRKK